MKRSTKKKRSTFADKVRALRAKGFSDESAHAIAGAMRVHEKGRLTKREKKEHARALKKMRAMNERAARR